MNISNLNHIEITDITLEEILYQYNKEEKNYFFSRIKSKGINKIIFITKHFNKDLEELSIQCIQKNLQILVLFEQRLIKNPDQIWDYINETEKVLIIFSKHCDEIKRLFLKHINFDPIRDEVISPKEEQSQNIKESIAITKQKEKSERTHLLSNKVFEAESEKKDIKDSDISKTNESIKEPFEEPVSSVELTEEIPKIKPSESPNEQEALLKLSKSNLEEIDSDKKTKEKEIITKPIEKTSESIFKQSKLTIRTKLMGITAIIITFSLSAMIFAASYFFKRDIETQIQTNNSNIVNIISQKIEDLIQQIYFDSDLIIKTFDENNPIINLKSFENPYIFSIAIIQPEKDSFKIEKWYKNDILMQQNALLTFDFEKTIPIYKDSIALSLTGIYNILNISPSFNIPVLLFIAPLKDTPGKLLLVFINAKKIIDDFPSEENSQTFMVNRKGDVLIFPDITLVQSAANLREMPIVKMMLESKLDNGLTNFVYKNIEFLGTFKKISIAGIGIIKITETKKAFEPVYATQRRNLYILGIVLIIGIIIVYFFSKTISQPIKELAIATEKVEQEDYSVRVIPKTKDEVGLLAYSFNKMVKGLEERERMKDAFGRFVNKEIAEKAMRGEIKLGGEKKECAVFFSDLRGFTAMSEKMKPEEVVEYLNRYFTLMVDCVEKTHGVVDKFIGDAIMATWGAVTSYGNDTENAINGALLMRKALIEFNEYNKKHNLPIAKFGCGINTGEVISGQIGSEKRLEFTVIGDAVNLASRIEALNKPFATDILISQDSYEKVKDIFNVVKMPAIKVKGKTEPQTIYCVLGRKDDPDCPKSLDELRKLVGIDWKPQIKEGQETLEEDKEEKYEILQ
ncbi:MAG: hypothetical protein KatS3mg129_3109 [Leptospiraceae bacterium]|nr:MAG: hypothetical protein KatS3mg129_3109 [Leptospiraceae bacterium]